MMLNTSSSATGQPTPPGSSGGSGGPSSPEPLRLSGEHRRGEDRESIRIYAEPQVLSLFNDIEQAIGRMCEAC